MFEGEGSYSIGVVMLDPKNPCVVWVGSGENNSQRSVSIGDGVYKSTDAGKSWKNVGLPKSEHIGKIIVDPHDSNVVYVAAQGPLWASGGDRGLYKTTDGGKSWKPVLTISENTGVSDSQQGHKTGWSSNFTVKRSDFGMSAMQGMVADEVQVFVDFEAARQ